MTHSARGQRPRVRGNTLIEVIVVLTILGVVATVTGLAVRAPRDPPLVGAAEARVAEARRQAIRNGRPITVTVTRRNRVVSATAHADGRVVVDSSFVIDRLSGRITR